MDELKVIVHARHDRRYLRKVTLVVYWVPDQAFGFEFKWRPKRLLSDENRGADLEWLINSDKRLPQNAHSIIRELATLDGLIGCYIPERNPLDNDSRGNPRTNNTDWCAVEMRGHLDYNQVQRINDRIINRLGFFFDAKCTTVSGTETIKGMPVALLSVIDHCMMRR